MGISRLSRRLALAALPLSLLGAAPAPQPMFAAVKEGQPAPPFTLRMIKGGTVSLDELRGTVIVLNFWATWCVPCRT
ncbi:TlpA family protein disulfide reductase, partial [Staphylococcus aureus]|uniref:TlpA family protein disulfide reductase n=2 Tax=Bacteria TaxID=2 RepID=UPI00190F2F2C